MFYFLIDVLFLVATRGSHLCFRNGLYIWLACVFRVVLIKDGRVSKVNAMVELDLG